MASIAANGTRMTYLRGDRIVVHDLPSGHEREVALVGTPQYVGDDVYDLDTAKRVAKITDLVLGDARGHVLLAQPAAPCEPDPGGLPYACVDGVPNLAAGGAAGLPQGPLHWSP